MTLRRKYNEAKFQKALVEFIRNNAIPGVLPFHVNNNGRNAIQGARLKALGVVAGIADIVLLAPEGKVFLLELKAKKGRLSDSQKEIKEFCNDWNIPWAEAHDFQEAIHWLKEWGLISARVAA